MRKEICLINNNSFPCSQIHYGKLYENEKYKNIILRVMQCCIMKCFKLKNVSPQRISIFLD